MVSAAGRWGRAHFGDVVLDGHVLDPHGLPDAGDRRVPDAFRLRMLLSARLVRCARRVIDRNDEFVVAFAQVLADVHAEGIEAACVGGGVRTVDPDRRVVVDGTEVQERAQLERRDGEGAPVPQTLVRLHPARHAGELAFDAERHNDVAVPGARHGLGTGPDSVLPATVEVRPRVAHQLRARILAPRILGRHGFAPRSQHAIHDAPERRRAGDDRPAARERERACGT